MHSPFIHLDTCNSGKIKENQEMKWNLALTLMFKRFAFIKHSTVYMNCYKTTIKNYGGVSPIKSFPGILDRNS